MLAKRCQIYFLQYFVPAASEKCLINFCDFSFTLQVKNCLRNILLYDDRATTERMPDIFFAIFRSCRKRKNI